MKLLYVIAFALFVVGVTGERALMGRRLDREHMDEWAKKQEDGSNVGRRLGPPYCGDCGHVHCQCEKNDDTDDTDGN